MQQVVSFLRGYSLARASPLLCQCALPPASSSLCRFSTKYFNVSYDAGKSVATLQMNRPPVNSLTLEFLTEMSIVLDKLHSDEQTRALVLASTLPRTFSAGFDISELLQTKRERGLQFFETFQDVCSRLFSSRLVTIAAINGHCIAGGYILAMTCDHRIMANGPFKVGINGAELGLILPQWICVMFSNIAGTRMAERASRLGLLFSPEEAKAAHLVDQLVDGSQMAQAVDSEVKRWLKIPDATRQVTKANFRQQRAEQQVARKKDEAEAFVSHFMKDSIQRALTSYKEQMKSKKSKK